MMALIGELGKSEGSVGEEENGGTRGEGRKKPKNHHNGHLTVS